MKFVLRLWIAVAAVCPMGVQAMDPLSVTSTELQVASLETLDIDGNGKVDALTDGLMVLRFMMGLRGQNLIANAIGPAATRATAVAVEDYLNSLTSALPALCSLSASPVSSAAAPLAPGTQVTITATCAKGLLPITYSWDNGAYVGSVRTVAPLQNTTYVVTATNAAGQTQFQMSVYVGAQPSSNFCTGSDLFIDLPWPPTGQPIAQTNGFANQRVAFRITVPTTFSPPLDTSHLGFLQVTEVPGTPPTPREFTVSRSACDFQSPGQYIYDGTGYAIVSPSVNFTVNNPTGYYALNADFNLTGGDVVYFNVRNSNNGAPACSSPPCDIRLNFATPNRY